MTVVLSDRRELGARFACQIAMKGGDKLTGAALAFSVPSRIGMLGPATISSNCSMVHSGFLTLKTGRLPVTGNRL